MVAELRGLGRVVLRSTERAEQVGQVEVGGGARAQPLLTPQTAPVPGNLAAHQRQRQSEQVLRSLEDKSLVAQTQRQAAMDGLDKIDRIEGSAWKS